MSTLTWSNLCFLWLLSGEPGRSSIARQAIHDRQLRLSSRLSQLRALLVSDFSDHSMASLLLVQNTDWLQVNVIIYVKVKEVDSSVYSYGKSRPFARKDAKIE